MPPIIITTIVNNRGETMDFTMHNRFWSQVSERIRSRMRPSRINRNRKRIQRRKRERAQNLVEHVLDIFDVFKVPRAQ